MEQKLRQMFEECLQQGSKDDLLVLSQLLEGIRNKQTQKNGSYIGGLLHMNRILSGDTCEVTIPLSPLVNNSLGIVHGGITATLIDSAMGTVANSLLPQGFGAVTSQLNVYYIGIGQGDSLSCKARVSHKGSKTMIIDADVYRTDGKRIAQASGTFFIIEK